jgi:hypothetical protein
MVFALQLVPNDELEQADPVKVPSYLSGCGVVAMVR